MGFKMMTKLKAAKHHEWVLQNYEKETRRAINETKEYTWLSMPHMHERNGSNFPVIAVVEKDTVEELKTEAKANPDLRFTVLNFASFKKPGGGYMKGSMAQEESLCHASNLYEILSGHKDWYEQNAHRQHGGLYEDRLLYSPDVIFGVDHLWQIKADVITCAAPNISRCYMDYTINEIYRHLLHRTELILSVVDTDILILGAWGCGVFKNPPDLVARSFYTNLMSFAPKVSRVVFAIPGPKDTIDTFKNRVLLAKEVKA